MKYLPGLLLLACTGTTRDSTVKGNDSGGPTDSSGNHSGDSRDTSGTEQPKEFKAEDFANASGEEASFYYLTPEGAGCVVRRTLSAKVIVRSDCTGCEFVIDLSYTFDAVNSDVTGDKCNGLSADGKISLDYHPNPDGLGP